LARGGSRNQSNNGGGSVKTSGFLSIFADALAMNEPVLQQTLREYVQNPKSREDRDQAGWDEEWPTSDDLIQGDGVAVIPVHGLMIKRNRWWCCGVDHWSNIVDNLTQRLDVNAIVFDFDTGGGQVAGTERLGDAVWKARQSGKTTIAVVNEFCASAGLWVASQCDRIVIPATGSIGSLGVYTMHFDDTKYFNEQWGIEKSVIYRGKYKAIDERPLDGDGKAELQRFIDGKYSLFVDAVARGRGLSPEEVMSRWGESQMFTGSEAVSNGLADELGTLQDVLASLKAGRNGRVSTDCCPEDDLEDPEEGDPQAMKLNAHGQFLDAAGKVVGNLSELSLDSAGVQKHFGEQVRELVDSAASAINKSAADKLTSALADAQKASMAKLDELVAAVGPEKAIAAFKAGKDVVAAKAETADELAAQLKAKDEEIAKLKEAANAQKPPKFAASDAGSAGAGKNENSEDPDSEYAAAYAKDGSGFPNLKAFAAFQRYQARRAEKV
jgi:hypothetical protein